MNADVGRSLGAVYLGGGRTRFRVWAPKAPGVEVRLVGPEGRVVPLGVRERGYHEGVVEGVGPGAHYFYRLGGDRERPDPASRHQPEGVHGPSQVVDGRFDWHDGSWSGPALQDYVLYELHVGTFTPEGTFAAVIPHLDALKELGVTAVELMPVGQFPGGRNWGYDGAYPFAVQDSYGGPDGLKGLVDACHARGLAVVLDVVYNHLGPEGNYLAEYGPYFTEAYRTGWGQGMNFDGPDSDEVRAFFLENARTWLEEFHFDALRLDAVHAIKDFSARPFLQELAEQTAALAGRLRRRLHLIAESDLNDARLIRPREQGGCGLDAQWADDLHHALHSLLTGERGGYYQDFGGLDHLARAYRTGFTYAGDYSPFRRRRHGNSPCREAAWQFVVCAQNHDQVGNRMLGERLGNLVGLDGLKAAAGLVLLSPYVPLLFMGEEYGEPAPFLYFTSHGDTDLVEAVRRGRCEEFAHFCWQGEVPDPQGEETFERSKLRHGLRHEGQHRVLWEFYRELLRLRKGVPALARLSKDNMEVRGHEKEKVLAVRRWAAGDEVLQAFNLGGARAEVAVPAPAGAWHKVLDSAEARWLGPGGEAPERVRSGGDFTLALAPRSFVVYRREGS